MKERSFDEMIAYFNRRVSEMDIAQYYKMELLGMVTALGYKHEKTAQKWIPCSERLPYYSETVIVSILDDTGDCNLNYTDVGWITHDGTWIVDNDENNMATAWMPLPEPWRGEEHGET